MTYTHSSIYDGTTFGRGMQAVKVGMEPTYGVIKDEYGSLVSTTAVRIAQEKDFQKFKNAMLSLGYPKAGGDPADAGTRSMSPLAVSVLILRYPFITNLSSDNLPYLDSTLLNCLPDGWVARFGLELLEDLYEVLTKYDDAYNKALEKYAVTQVKEKYGTLRWYDNAPAGDERMHEGLSDLVMLYELLSGATCSDCGAIDHIYQTTSSYIIPTCANCYFSSDCASSFVKEANEAIDAIAVSGGFKGYNDFMIPRDLKKKMREVVLDESDCFENMTQYDIASASDITVHKPAEPDIRYNAYKHLKENYPDLRIFDLINERNAAMIAHGKPSREDVIKELAESHNQQHDNQARLL